MNEQAIKAIVEEVVGKLAKLPSAEKAVPMAVSARHCHLSQTDIEVLFGTNYQLTKKAELSQPGQFAANETITLVGPRGAIEKVRILGPARDLTQVEVSATDSIKLGVKPPLRESGDIENSAPITLVGPKGSIYKQEGLIIAQAHIHMTPEDAASFSVENGEYVTITTNSERPITFNRVLIRVSPRYQLEMHIDTDEANAGLIGKGASGILAKMDEKKPYLPKKNPPVKQSVTFQGKLLTEQDVTKHTEGIITLHKETIITPLALDAVRRLGKTIQLLDSKGAD